MNLTKLKTRWQHLSEGEICALQAARLREYLRDTVLPFSAHYRRLFHEHGVTADSIRSLADLARIPFTSKADLLNTPDHPEKLRDFLLLPDQKVLAARPQTILRVLLKGRQAVKNDFEREFRPIFMTTTTGRSADPVPFLYSAHDLANLESAGKRLFAVCGAKPEMRLINMFPYAPHLAFWLAHYGGAAFGLFEASSGGGKVMGTEGNLRMLRKIKPDGLIGTPTFIYHLLHLAVEEGMRCENLVTIVLGGEKVPEGMRRKLRHLARQLGSSGVQVIGTYGFTEAKTAWGECPHPDDAESSGYHLYPDLGLFEVIDPKTGVVVGNETPGELVFTPLDARASVVLRYRTGDFIEGGLTYAPCPYCQRRVPRLRGKISRSSEVKEMQLDKIKGTLVDFNQLEHVLDDAAHIGTWQLEIRKQHDDPLELDELVLHVEKTGNLDDRSLTRELDKLFCSRTEIHPNRIVFHDADEMRQLQGVGTQLKEQRIVDHRPPVHAEPSRPVETVSGTQSAPVGGESMEFAK